MGAVIAYAFFLYVFSPMNMLVIGWFADFDDAISHRVHEVSIGALFTLGFAGVVAQLRRRDRTTGAVQAVVALAVAAGVISVSTGFEPLVLAYLVPPLVLIALDPEWRAVVVPPLRRDFRLLVIAALLLSILGPDIAANFEKATLLVQRHESHWGAMAAFVIAVTLLSFVAAFRPPGWRLAAWSAAGAVAVSTAVSLAFPYDASALGLSNALAALLWVAGCLVTVAVVAARHPERIPVRRRGEGLVAGVATALARRTGWKVGWLRAAFALPVIGGAAYGLLWLVLPSERKGERAGLGRLPILIGLLAAGVLGTGAGFGGFIILLLAFGGALFLGLRPLLAFVRGRVPFWRSVTRIAAGAGLGLALMAVAIVWLADEFGAPVVPHRIDSELVQYCVSCHGVPGAAQGAPVLVDYIEHSGGDACVSCHAHLPPVTIPSASWLPGVTP